MGYTCIYYIQWNLSNQDSLKSGQPLYKGRIFLPKGIRIREAPLLQYSNMNAANTNVNVTSSANVTLHFPSQFDDVTGTLTITGNATTDVYAALLENITYLNT